jgi:hypothetical protein
MTRQGGHRSASLRLTAAIRENTLASRVVTTQGDNNVDAARATADIQVRVLIEEYKAVHAEKRLYEQAVLAVAGVAAAAAGVLIANIDARDPIAAAGLLPLAAIVMWLLSIMRTYVGMFMEHLLELERKIATLAGLEFGRDWQPLELRWFREESVRRQFTRFSLSKVAGIAAVALLVLLIPGSAYALRNAAVVIKLLKDNQAVSEPVAWALLGFFLLFNAIVLVSAAAAWLRHEARIRDWTAAEKRRAAVAMTSPGTASATADDGGEVAVASRGSETTT